MADVVVGAKLEADASGAINSVKSFKAELRQAQTEVVLIAEKFGVASKEAAAAAKRAAELKDQIEDARSLTDAFNPDTKFRAFGAAINTVVGGFSALQGVMGLVGAEGEEVQKALLKVQSAMAISQGVAQMQEGVQTFKNLGAVIQQTTLFQKLNAAATALASAAMRAFGVSVATTSTGFKVLKVAIASTGIGLLVVGLSVLIPKITEWISSSDAAALSQDQLNEAIERVNDSLDKNLNKIDFSTKKNLLNAEIAGKSEKELQEIKETGLRKELTQLAVAATLKAQLANRAIAENKLEVSELNKLRDDALEAERARQKKYEELQLSRLSFQAQQAKKARDDAKKNADEARTQAEKDRKEEAERQGKLQAANSLGQVGGVNIEIPKTPEQLALEAEIAARAVARKDKEAYDQYTAESTAQFTKIHKENVDARIAAEQAELEAKRSFANASASILGSLSDLVGRQTKLGKILALAEIASGTATGFINALDIAQKSAKGTGPAAAFAFPIFYATQIAAVLGAAARAKSLLGGGGATVSAPTAVTAPLTPQRPERQTTTLDQQSLNAIGNATTRAFFLESDFDDRERIVRLNRMARLGD